MNDQELILAIEEIKALMIKAATGQADIVNVDEEYKSRYIILAREFKKRGINNNNDHFSLWDFYSFWKENGLSTYQSRRQCIQNMYRDAEYSLLIDSGESVESVKSGVSIGYSYFSNERIEEIKGLNSSFDLGKLVRILDEVNICYKNQCYLGVSCLLRMLIDHIPPIFGKNNFTEVANNFPFSKSDKQVIAHLLGGLKNIADGNLHNQIGTKEFIPTKQGVEFRADFDILLKNIIVVLS